MDKKTLVSYVLLGIVSFGTLMSIFDITCSVIFSRLFGLFGSMNFILIPFSRFFESGNPIDIIVLILFLSITILLLFLTITEVVNKNRDRFPIFSFLLFWWFVCCGCSVLYSNLLSLKQDLSEDLYYELILFVYLIASLIVFIIGVFRYRRTHPAGDKTMSIDTIKKSFISCVFVPIIVAMYCYTFLYFLSLTEAGKNISGFIMNLGVIFTIIEFMMIYLRAVNIYKKYRVQNEIAYITTDIKRIMIYGWVSLAIFIVLFILKLVFIW